MKKEIIDPISERFPRRHDYRRVQDFAEIKRAASYVVGVAAIVGSLGIGIVEGKRQIDAANAEGTDLAFSKDLIDCHETRLDYPNLDAQNIDYQIVDNKSVATAAEVQDLSGVIFAAPSDVAAEADLEKFLKTKAVKLTSNTATTDVNTQLTREETNNLAVAISSLPKSFIKYTGVSFELDPVLEGRKSKAQLDLEKSSGKSGQLGYSENNLFAADYNPDSHRVRVSYNALGDPNSATETVWHEVAGHAVLMKACSPTKDKKLAEIDTINGHQLKYLPTWKRSDSQEAFFSSKIATANSYGGSSQDEDVATEVEAIVSDRSIYTQPQDWSNFSLNPAKQTHILEVLKTIEPNIEPIITNLSLQSRKLDD